MKENAKFLKCPICDNIIELMRENEKIFVVRIGNRNYAHKLLLDKWLLAQVRK